MSKDKTAIIWNLNTGEMLFKLVGHIYAINSLGISPDNKKVVTGSDDALAIIWDMNTG